MKNKFDILKNNIFSLLFYFLITNISYSEVIKSIEINGNDRIADETVIMFSSLKIGDEVNQDILNNSLKELYYTDYFKNVELSFEQNVVLIEVEENPIIQSITIEELKVIV